MKATRLIYSIAMAALLLPSCSDNYEEKFEKINETAVLNVNVGDASDTLVLIEPMTANILVRVEATRVSDSPLTLTLGVDPSKVDEYNAAHGTNYTIVPGNAYQISDGVCILPRYNTLSSTLNLTLSSANVSDEKTHIMPIVISKVDGSDNVKADSSVAYIFFRKGLPDASKAYVTVKNMSALQETINSCAAGMTVRVGAGTLSGVQLDLKKGVNISGGWNSDFTVCDPAKYPTVLDGNGAVVPISQADDFGRQTVISGLTVKNGRSVGDGGCIVLKANGVIDNCIITGGNAQQGAGIFINGAGIIRNSTVSNNTSTSHGGGIYLASGASAINCVAENNTSGANGGGINCNNSANIDRCVVRNNTANNGGGISLRSATFPGMFLGNSLIYGNHSKTASGSGLHMYASSARPITVYNCTIADNVNDEAGGYAYGIYCNDKHIWFVNNIVYGNKTSGDDTGKLQMFMNCGETTFVDGPYLYNNAVTAYGINFKAAKYTSKDNIDLDAVPYGSDFSLLAGSICINKGLSTFDCNPNSSEKNAEGALVPASMSISAKDLDLAGNSRILGSAPDLGCYEKQ